MPSLTRPLTLAGALAAFAALGSTVAAAQGGRPAAGQGGSRAVDQAGDAFGVRIGVEQIGLYSESQVRGLSLQEAGNYRLGGAYFIRAGNLIDPVLSGVLTRVGFNALEADFPAPSGVVEYRLRSPLDDPGSSFELSLREYGGRFAEAITSQRIGGTAGLLVGVAANRAVTSAGFHSNSDRLAALGEWRPVDGARVLMLATVNRFDLQGSFAVTATGDALPPPQQHPNRRLLPDWGDHDGLDRNIGTIVTVTPRQDVTVRASAIYSRLDLDESDFVNMALDADGVGRATIISNRPRDVEAFAAALSSSWNHRPGKRIFAEARYRASRNTFSPATALQVLGFNQDVGLPVLEEPDQAAAPASMDRATQVTVGIGYEANFRRLRLKGGLQRAFHSRRFEAPEAAPTSSSESPWLYDASLVLGLSKQSTMFATLTRGLEDSGVAPSRAANRNEVLPAVVAMQSELGLRHRLTDRLTLIASAFSVKKPTPVFDASDVYSLSGNVRHRGLEFSLAGQLLPGLRIVTGAALLDARRSGERVRLGLTAAEVPGVSRYQFLTGATWSVPGLERASLDMQLNHSSSRLVRSDRELRTPPVTTVDVGALYGFKLGPAAASLRLRLNNLFNTDSWNANRAELLDRVPRRGLRLSLALRDRH